MSATQIAIAFLLSSLVSRCPGSLAFGWSTAKDQGGPDRASDCGYAPPRTTTRQKPEAV